MDFWQYIIAPTGTSFGIVAINMLIISVLVVLIGIALIKLPQEFAQGLSLRRRTKAERKQIGDEEYKMQSELQIKAGIGIIVWGLALVISFVASTWHGCDEHARIHSWSKCELGG